MKGSLRLGTPSACAHSSSFAASFVAMVLIEFEQSKRSQNLTKCFEAKLMFERCIGALRDFLPEPH
jgi:hypothetical protein